MRALNMRKYGSNKEKFEDAAEEIFLPLKELKHESWLSYKHLLEVRRNAILADRVRRQQKHARRTSQAALLRRLLDGLLLFVFLD